MHAFLRISAKSDPFFQIAKTCSKKCIYKHDDSELEIAEMACADRCVTKFMQAQNLVRIISDARVAFSLVDVYRIVMLAITHPTT